MIDENTDDQDNEDTQKWAQKPAEVVVASAGFCRLVRSSELWLVGEPWFHIHT